MKIRLLILTLICAVSFNATAQNEFQQEVISYLTVNGTVKEYSDVYDDMIEVLRQQFTNANVPEEEWEAIAKEKPKAITQLVQMMSSAYRNHFTREDISQMSAFFSSPAGKQMRLNPEELTEEQEQVVGMFFSGGAGLKMGQVKDEWSRDVTQVSEYWSRDLFNGTMNSLIAKGYSPQ